MLVGASEAGAIFRVGVWSTTHHLRVTRWEAAFHPLPPVAAQSWTRVASTHLAQAGEQL